MLNRPQRIMLLILVPALLLALAIYFQLNRDSYLVYSSWSKQDEWIVFSCGSSGEPVKSSIYLIRSNGNEVQRITNDKIVASAPTWSPDGDEIAFIGIVNGKENIYRLKRGGKKTVAITKLDARTWVGDIAWSPDGQWIAFVSAHLTGETLLQRVKVDGSVREPIISEEIRGQITWSPDGQRIAFRSFQDIHNFGVRTIRTDGSELLSVASELYAQPSWSPSGEQLAIEDHDIYLVRPDGSQLRQITDLPRPAGTLAWSPDEQWVVFTYYGAGRFTQLFKVKADGSDLQQITDMDCNASDPDWIKMPEG
jgi:TolB protein